MTKHVLDIFEEVKKVQINDLNEIGMLSMYKKSIGEWGQALNIEDFEAIDRVSSWEKLLALFDKIQGRYQSLWLLAGSPTDWESWSKKLDRDAPDFVGAEYWKIYHSEVKRGKKQFV